jgi:hypothetical protein
MKKIDLNFKKEEDRSMEEKKRINNEREKLKINILKKWKK